MSRRTEENTASRVQNVLWVKRQTGKTHRLLIRFQYYA